MTKDQIDNLKRAMEAVRDAVDKVQQVKTDLEVAYDELTEDQQESEKGEELQSHISDLDDADARLSDAVDKIGGLV